MKYGYVQAERERYGVRRLCRLLGVSSSGFYVWQRRPESARAQRRSALLEVISAVHDASRQTYGAPRVHAELQARGVSCCRNTVARLMRARGLCPKTVRRFRVTTDSRHTQAVPDLLQRDFHAPRPDWRWASDITFIPTRGGWLYLAVVLDLYSRAIVGWAMRERMHRELVLAALQMALDRRQTQPGTVVHSDQGTLYACTDYRALLHRHGLVGSMSRKGNCWDNAVVESFFHTLKTELVDHADYLSREQARSSLFEYMEVFYNQQRRHSTLGYRTPLEFERLHATPN